MSIDTFYRVRCDGCSRWLDAEETGSHLPEHALDFPTWRAAVQFAVMNAGWIELKCPKCREYDE